MSLMFASWFGYWLPKISGLQEHARVGTCSGKKKRENIFKQRWNNKQINNKANIPFITHKHPKSYVTSFYILHFASPSELQGGVHEPTFYREWRFARKCLDMLCFKKKLLENAKTFFWRGGTRPHGGTHFLDRQNSRTFFLGSKKARRWHI